MKTFCASRSQTRSTTPVQSFLRDLRKPEVGEGIWSRFSQPREKTLWYYRNLADKFRQKWPGQLANELYEIVEVLENGAAAEDGQQPRRSIAFDETPHHHDRHGIVGDARRYLGRGSLSNRIYPPRPLS
jgi:hypothetical protein